MAGALPKIGWGLMTLLSVGVACYALYHVATNFEHVPGAVLKNAFPSGLGIRAHILFAGIALLTGPWQFSGGLRRTRPKLHRWTGRIYVLACTLGGLAGGATALFTTAGPIAGWGFFVLALLWVPFTLLAWQAAMRQDFDSHKRWMIRSFALTFGAATLRIYLPIGLAIMSAQGARDPFTLPYTIIAWAAWLPNLLVVEAWLRSRPSRTQRKAVTAAA